MALQNDDGTFKHDSGYSNTNVTEDINKGSNAEYNLGRQRIADAQKDIAFSPDWFKEKWNSGTKGKVGAIMSGVADAISGLKGLNFTTGTAGGNTRTGQALENVSQDYRTVGQAAAEDAMGLQKAANQNEANRRELENNLNQSIKYGRELSQDQLSAIRNFKNAVGNVGITDELITSLINGLFNGFKKEQ